MGAIFFAKLPPVNWRRFFSVALLFLIEYTYGQPPIPKFDSFQPININASPSTSPERLFSQASPLISEDRYTAAQNQKILQRAGMLPGPVPVDEQRADQVQLAEQELRASSIRGAAINDFQDNFNQFLRLDPNQFSISKAVYLSESAYYDRLNRP
ncbi:MAG TPA: hypothetical protein VG605_19165, partial [Puia sp.]|nr:hypothetical protein [Puia sp.]